MPPFAVLIQFTLTPEPPYSLTEHGLLVINVGAFNAKRRVTNKREHIVGKVFVAEPLPPPHYELFDSKLLTSTREVRLGK